MNEKVNINKTDGSSIMADLICFIENTTTGKRYIYYTLNEVVGAGTSSTVKIYVSKVKQDDPTLDAPITEEEWGALKGYMGDALKGNSNPAIKYIPMSELVNPTSVSERAIAMPTSYDYINKQRGIYATSVAGANATEGAQNTPAPEATNPALEPVQEPVPAAPSPVEPTPLEPQPAPEPVAPTPEPAPTVAPVVEPPVSAPQEAPISPEAPAAPTVEPTPVPVEPAAPLKVEEPTPMVPPVDNNETAETDSTSNPSSAAVLKPIDINEIEAKYAEMSKNLENLKNLEIEAAKRYNATIELQEMHNEQHASYIENEQAKVTPIAGSPIVEPTPAPTPAPVQEPVPAAPEVGPVPTVAPEVASPAPIAEPTPVTPVTPEPVAAAPADIETNWFDMPSNNA